MVADVWEFEQAKAVADRAVEEYSRLDTWVHLAAVIVWNRYGLIGVAFQSPVFAGTLLSTLVALGLGAPARKLLFWISVSLVFWGTVLTGAAVLGFSIFESWQVSEKIPF